MGGENDDILVKKVVLWLWEALIGDDFSEGLVGGVGFWSEERHRFVEFASEGGGGVVLEVVIWEKILFRRSVIS